MPPKRFLSPSRSSTASFTPVDAPDGTAARPTEPSSRTTSTSMVGLPRESRISRASIWSIVVSTFMPVPRRSPWSCRSAPGGRSRRMAIPGSSRPSRNSSEAPPPVLMWVIWSARSCCWTAATESPPPTTTVAPASALAARKRAIALVPWANDGISNTPRGPFQKTVRAGSSASSMSSRLFGPTSTIRQLAGIFSAGRVLYSVPRVTSLATTTSTGRMTGTPRVSAAARIRRASSTRSGSARLLPIALPWARRNVLAMPPPTTRRSTLVRRCSRTLILSETFAPPTTAANGRAGSSMRFESALISASMSRPA